MSAVAETRPMRVMHVIASLSGYWAERFVSDLLPLLARDGAEVAALTVYPEKGGSSNGHLAGIPVYCAGRTTRVEVRFFPRMVRAIRDFRPAIVHTHMHNGKYWGRLAAVAAGGNRIVHTEHDSNLNRLSVERVADAVLTRATARFVAFSEGQRQRLARAERIPLSRIVVIPNGVVHRALTPDARERGRAALRIGPQGLAVIMIGRLEAPKNHELALRAFAQLPPDIAARARLFLAGDGSLRDWLRALGDELAIGDRVEYLGFRSDALDLLAGADAMLMTSPAESMPIALIEAMGAGTPVVSTPWLGAEDMLDRGKLGYIAEDFEPAAIARSLAQALRDVPGAQSRARAARERALAFYDLGAAARRHIDLYRSVLEST